MTFRMDFMEGHGYVCPRCEHELQIAVKGMTVDIQDCKKCGWPLPLGEANHTGQLLRNQQLLKRLRNNIIEGIKPPTQWFRE